MLVGPAGSAMLGAFAQAGFAVASEAFADRSYEPDGRPRSRRLPDAVNGDPAAAAAQALRIAQMRRVITANGSEIALDAQTICAHGDTPGCVQIAAAVAAGLRAAGFELASHRPHRC